MARPQMLLYVRIRHVTQDRLPNGRRGAWKSVADLPHEAYGQRSLDAVGDDDIVPVEHACVSSALGGRYELVEHDAKCCRSGLGGQVVGANFERAQPDTIARSILRPLQPTSTLQSCKKAERVGSRNADPPGDLGRGKRGRFAVEAFHHRKGIRNCLRRFGHDSSQMFCTADLNNFHGLRKSNQGVHRDLPQTLSSFAKSERRVAPATSSYPNVQLSVPMFDDRTTRMLARHNAPLSFSKAVSVAVDTKSKSSLNHDNGHSVRLSDRCVKPIQRSESSRWQREAIELWIRREKKLGRAWNKKRYTATTREF